MCGFTYLKGALPAAVAAVVLAMVPATARSQDPYSELKVLIEINATDGDAGFHALGDGDEWKQTQLFDPNGNKLMKIMDHNALREQGLTEIFFESAEPLCAFDEEEPEEEVVPLAEFLERFPAGDYLFSGVSIEGEPLEGVATLTYNLPAAPDISATDEAELDPEDVVVSWTGGTTLGDKCHDDLLVMQGIIADPAAVPVVGWEVVVEPDDEEASDPLRVFSIQLPPGQTSITIPEEYFAAYIADEVTEFKFEVGAIEDSGNQTFSEGTFELVVEED